MQWSTYEGGGAKDSVSLPLTAVKKSYFNKLGLKVE